MVRFRAGLKIPRGAAAGDFGLGQGGADGASPQRAVTAATTKSQGKRPAARWVFALKTIWLRYSSVEDPQGVFSFVTPCHLVFSPKTAPLGILRPALGKWNAPAAIRELGGAIYGDRRYGRVFIGHNGAETYYRGRGFRGSLKI